MIRTSFSLLFLFTPLLVAQPKPTFRVETQLIRVPVTILAPDQRAGRNLNREHFQLFDESESRQIENFVLDTTPLSIVFLLDSSASLQSEIEEIKETVYHFVASVGKEDRSALVTFSDEVVVLQRWTNSRRKIRKALRNLKPGYRTALYDALSGSAVELLRRVPGKRVIIVLTDGLDNESRVSYEKVIEDLVRQNVSLYVVSRTRLVRPQVAKSERVEFLNRVMKNVLGEAGDFVDAYFKEKEAALIHLAQATGGRAFFPRKLGELVTSYRQLAHELKTQYLLTFRPPRVSHKTFRSIRVICTKPVMKMYYRDRYYWSPPSSE